MTVLRQFRHPGRLGVLVLVLVTIAAIGGSSRGAASTASVCNAPDPTGRQFCVQVTDTDGVSPSGIVGSGKRQVAVTAYQSYTFSISNVAGSTLTNGSTTIRLTDNVPAAAPVDSTAVFVPSASSASCAVVSTTPNVVRCTLPNLPAGGSTAFTVGYRTSNTPNVTSTDATITTTVKEGTNTNGANPSSVTFVENTSLEPDPESSVSLSPPGQSVKLGTSPTFDQQFSRLEYTVPNGHSTFISHLTESGGSVCAPTLSCFGELVQSDLSGADAGTFSSTNLFHLTITMSQDLMTSGNVNAVKLSHRLDSGSFEIISARCSSSPPAAGDTIPCIQVEKFNDNKTKLLIVDAWAKSNGSWQVGG